VTILILLALICLLWAAVLAPSAWRRFKERQGDGSIDHFHHQLRLLERTSPAGVASASLSHAGFPRRHGTYEAAVADSSRPRLVLLRPTDDARTADVDDNEGRHYERVCVLDPPEPLYGARPGAGLPAYRRELARRRCTVLLAGLTGVAIITGFMGTAPGMQVAWVFTGLSGLVALGLVGLMSFAKAVETELRLRRARAWTREREAFSEPHERFGDGARDRGTWNDDVVEVRAAAY
jgi:uncharacterized membrane protein YuzA (DUF378 family)